MYQSSSRGCKACSVKIILGSLGGSVGYTSAFGSGHDLEVLGSSSALGSLLSGGLLFPFPLHFLHPLSLALSLLPSHSL